MATFNALAWLKRFCSRPEMVEIMGDDLGTTRQACGAVVLAALLTQTQSPTQLAATTNLPSAFCAVVMAGLDPWWRSESFQDLCRTIGNDPEDFEDIDHSLNTFLEDFWVRSTLPGMTEMLPVLRGRSLAFGRVQVWIDGDLLDDLFRGLLPHPLDANCR